MTEHLSRKFQRQISGEWAPLEKECVIYCSTAWDELGETSLSMCMVSSSDQVGKSDSTFHQPMYGCGHFVLLHVAKAGNLRLHCHPMAFGYGSEDNKRYSYWIDVYQSFARCRRARWQECKLYSSDEWISPVHHCMSDSGWPHWTIVIRDQARVRMSVYTKYCGLEQAYLTHLGGTKQIFD